MTEQLQIRQAVTKALQTGGITAVPAYAGQAKHWETPVIAVSVAEASEKTVGFCNYLGESEDPETGEVRERYGKQLSVVVSLMGYAPDPADCEAVMETAAEILLRRLPSGLRPGTFQWKPVKWTPKNRLFCRASQLECRAIFTAETTQEEPTFTDFKLKGVMTT